jgi:Uma2 family endonuclease
MGIARGTMEAMDATLDPYAPPPPPGQDELPSEHEPMESLRHLAQMNMLIEQVSLAWADRRDYFVGGNMFVYFSELQSRGEKFRGPDFFVVLETDRDKVRKSWVAWQEGGKLPDVVIELLSPSTENIDRNEKKRIYERVWRTGHYVLFDIDTLTIEAFELVRGHYVPITPDRDGRIAIESMGMTLGTAPGKYWNETGTWLRWFDADGRVLPLQAERADTAEARVRALEAELERQR